MKYITFYTPGFYEDVFHRHLGHTASEMHLDLRAYKEHNYQDWGLNTRLKAKVILRALAEWGDVIWLDADAELKRYPFLLESIPEEYDLAVYYLDWHKHWRGEEGHPERELVNSVMMVRHRPAVIELLEQWIENNTTSTIWEQKVFQDLLEKSSLKTYHLPNEYCAIVNVEGEVPAYIGEPVIIQRQVSRQVKADKKLLNGGSYGY